MKIIFEKYITDDGSEEYSLKGTAANGYPFQHRMRMFAGYWTLFFDTYGDYYPERGYENRRATTYDIKRFVIQTCELELLKLQFENKDLLAISQRAAGQELT